MYITKCTFLYVSKTAFKIITYAMLYTMGVD